MLLAMALLLAGCGTIPVETYRDEKPALDLRRYFDGTVDAWGMFQDRSGRVVKRFTVRIDAKWQGDTGVLDEHFEHSDGSKSRRVWTITRIDGNRYRGTADDVVGEAIGEVSGNALRWRYVLRLDVDGRSWNVDFDDWMYLMDDQVMLNRSVMSKFGIYLGEVTLAFRKRP
ncbi:MAG: DUF3833 domain-containing protein [Betaproteobacteria bacterium]|nr:DUF3833 domain-containing protein [Betaproteobacteria bacterium]